MDSYDKIKQIGKGSYGVVWLVKNKKDKKNYVLKQIDLRKSSKRDILSAQQEAHLLKRLKHPNIVSYKDSFETGGYLHIVMLYCEGGDLYSKIKERNGQLIEETQVVEWFVQIAMARQYMHENHILHRDLKTQNIFLTRNKIIKVGDLGIARVLKGNNDMATTMIGTPYYMSPELFSNVPYNSKSDVWALGCCVYEMTTLKHAFNAKDMTSLVFKITKGKMPSLPQFYTNEFITLIESMLNLDPKKRPSVNKILRDAFIKKNILLFLERTKEKQREQAEKEISNKIVLVNNNNNDIVQFPKPQLDGDVKPSPPSQENNSEPVRQPRVVRISAVVHNIEIKEKFHLEDDENDDDDDVRQYELTKPRFPRKEDDDDDFENDDPPPPLPPQHHEPKIMDKKSDCSPKIFSSASAPILNKNISSNNSSSSSLEQHKSEIGSDENLIASISSEKHLTANQQAREKRRQKLRQSQTETNNSNDSRPPMLRRLDKKMPLLPQKQQQSEIFYQNSSDNSKKNVSKSLNEDAANRYYPLQDSLKIFRQQNQINNNNNKPVSNKQQNISVIHHSKSIPNNMPSREEEVASGHLQQQQSSSSTSSVDSSGDEDQDPDKRLIHIEKRKEKDKKEVNSLIDQLNSTLNAVNLNKCDSEVDAAFDDDIQEETFDDLERDVIEAENKSNKNKNRKSVEDDEEEEEDEDDHDHTLNQDQIKQNKLPFVNNDDENDDLNGGITLGATNHMNHRINILEKEIVEAIGKDKLTEAFKILDSFKEEEIQPKLVKLIGPALYSSYSGKLWLLKFCKETAQISIR